MKDKTKKVWRFIKKHKNKILITIGAASTIAGGAYICSTMKRSIKAQDLNLVIKDAGVKTRVFPSLGVGEVGDICRYNDGTVEIWIDNLRIEDVGKLGEGIIDNVDGISPDAKIWALLDIREVTE